MITETPIHRNDRFRRGQVEWALWQYFATGPAAGGSLPKVFATRVKRLLELDRSKKRFPAKIRPSHSFAFFDSDPEGQGSDAEYSCFNVFCLAIGLDLLDAGFKQSEVVIFLKHVRADLAEQFEWIAKNPIAPRMKMSPNDRPECPTYEDRGGRYADCRVFLVVEKIEMGETYGKKPSAVPLIFAPTFCRGIEALQEELHTMNFNRRKVLVLELANTAVMIGELLDRAPEIRRGRR